MATHVETAPVDTGQVTGRRELRFSNLDDITADVQRLSTGGYRQLGNWPLGQMCQHLANAFGMALDGNVPSAPWPVRALARWLYKEKTLRRMKPGFKLPPKVAAVVIPSRVEDAQGIAALHTAIARWKKETQRHPHPFFGRLTPQEWEQIMLRHSEMHLSFLLPK